jgi:hypothetical protein
MTDTQFEMLATQVWIFMFGVSIGAMLVDFKFFWWLPLFIIICLFVTRGLLRIIDKRNANEQI